MENTTLEINTISDIGIMTQEQYIMLLESCYIMWFVMALIGVISNIINIHVFVVMGVNDGVTVSFLALAIFDLAYLITTLSISVSTTFYVIEMKSTTKFRIDPFAFVIFSANVMIVINISNILTTTFLAIVRCLCVARPLQFKNTITKNRAIYFMCGIAIFSFTIYVPFLATMGLVNKFDKSSNTSRLVLVFSKNKEITKNNVWIVTEMFLPITTQIVITFCVVIMVRCLRSAASFRQSSSNDLALGHNFKNKNDCSQKDISVSDSTSNKDKLTGKDLRVVQQVVLISVVYIVCNVPKMLITFCTVIEPEFKLGRRYWDVYLSVHFLRKHFEIVNAAVNLIIYYKYNTKFRSVLIK